MSGDPVGDFVQQLAVQLAAGTLTGGAGAIWAKLKEWIARRRRAALAVVDQFEVDPAAHAADIARVLREMQFDKDPEGRAILAERLNLHTVSQTASGQFVVQAGRDIGAVHVAPLAGGITRQPIGADAWGLLQRQHEADGDECVYVPEQNVVVARLEGWQEIVLPGPGGTHDRLVVVDGSHTLGVPMHRPLPWKGLSRTAHRMLARVVKGKGSLDHFQAGGFDIVRVHMDHRMYGFWDMPGASALGELARPQRQFLKRRGEALYFLTDDGQRVGEALLRARGEAWLEEPNPECREGWIS